MNFFFLDNPPQRNVKESLGKNGRGNVSVTRLANVEKRSAEYDVGYPFLPVVTKRVDGSMLKFPLRQQNRPRITLNQIDYLANIVCPWMMEAGDSVMANICSQVKVLEENLSNEEEKRWVTPMVGSIG